jgi:protein-S-isoprenylcysteine O-methyltransferase Ste14
VTLSRRAVAVIWALGVPLVHAGVPWLLARLGARHHGTWNLAGAPLVAAGAAIMVGTAAAHLRRQPARVPLQTSTTYLCTDGPYAWSRNPMYVAELLLWAGWALLFGSVAVAIGGAVLAVGVAMVVPWEERRLAARFGEAYEEYRSRVRRWVGRRRITPPR